MTLRSRTGKAARHDDTSVLDSWDQPLGVGFDELVLQTLATEGEEATLARLLNKLDQAPLQTRLSHDDGEGHGRVLGHSVLDFIDRWTLLGCVGPEEWLMVPFLRPDVPYLDPIGDRAQRWRAWFGLDVLAAL